MARDVITIPGMAAPKAPYNYATRAGDLVFLSGQLGLDPATGNLVSDDVAVQARQALRNLSRVLEAAGLTLGHVVKTNILLLVMADFAAVNAVYAELMPQPFPARTTVAVAGLPFGGRVEIEMIAQA